MTEDEQIAAFIAERGVRRLPKRKANAPAIVNLRQQMLRTGEVAVPRDGKRTIVFNPAPAVVERILQDEREARRRRRLANRQDAPGTRKHRQR